MRAWWRKRRAILVGTGLILLIAGSAWGAVVRREMALVRRVAGEIDGAVPTEAGLLYAPVPRGRRSSGRSALVLRGWDGRMCWRIALPPIDRAAWTRWYPASSGAAREEWNAPNGRVVAAVRMDARGARVLIWRDGRLRGEHRFPVQPGGVFDGRHWYDLAVGDDGRVFVYNVAYPVSPVVLLRDDRILARGAHRSTLRTHQGRFTRLLNAQGDIWTTTFTSPARHERLRLTITGARLTWRPLPLPPPPPARWTTVETGWDGAGLTRNGARLRVEPGEGPPWPLPPRADARATQAVVGTGGHSVLFVQAPATEAPFIRRARRALARLPGLRRLQAPPRRRWCTVYQRPGLLRGRGRLPLADDTHWCFALPDGEVYADPPWLAPDGRYLVVYAETGRRERALLYFKCW